MRGKAWTDADFESLYMPEPNTGCWLWVGATLSEANGYGSFIGAAHRYSFTRVNGPVPPGLFVCHRCDTPACVNPDHLFLGAQRDNLADMRRKGRQVEGEWQRRKTHCPRGHEYAGSNLVFWKNGRNRVCRACRAILRRAKAVQS